MKKSDGVGEAGWDIHADEVGMPLPFPNPLPLCELLRDCQSSDAADVLSDVVDALLGWGWICGRAFRNESVDAPPVRKEWPSRKEWPRALLPDGRITLSKSSWMVCETTGEVPAAEWMASDGEPGLVAPPPGLNAVPSSSSSWNMTSPSTSISSSDLRCKSDALSARPFA